jgi:hypothetical protein
MKMVIEGTVLDSEILLQVVVLGRTEYQVLLQVLESCNSLFECCVIGLCGAGRQPSSDRPSSSDRNPFRGRCDLDDLAYSVSVSVSSRVGEQDLCHYPVLTYWPETAIYRRFGELN